MIGLSADGEPVTVTVNAPRLQLVPELRRSIPTPKPSAKRDANGRVVLKRDPKGELVKNASGQPVPEVDFEDETFLGRAQSVERARTIAMIFACAEFPGETTITIEEHGGDWIAYWLARWEELESAGVDVGSYKALSDACVELSDPMSRSEIQDARAALCTDAASVIDAKEKIREEGKKPPKGK